MNPQLELGFVAATERAAIACARTMGQGQRKHSDHVAVEAMREVLDTLDMDGEIVIGEGERDEAPMLYSGEKLGLGKNGSHHAPHIDIAVDPLEGTNLCATGAPNAIAVLAAASKGGLLKAPDVYMEKIVVGPTAKGAVDLDRPVGENLKAIAKRFDRPVHDLTIIVLERDRHKTLIEEIRKAGARIKLIGDGDLSAGIAAAVRGTGIQAVMGIGGAPEGVLTAAAMRCLNGEILGRFVAFEKWQEKRLDEMGFTNKGRIYTTNELAPGRDIVFSATGVTDGDLLKGVRTFGDGLRTSSIFMTLRDNAIRFIDNIVMDSELHGPVTF